MYRDRESRPDLGSGCTGLGQSRSRLFSVSVSRGLGLGFSLNTRDRSRNERKYSLFYRSYIIMIMTQIAYLVETKTDFSFLLVFEIITGGIKRNALVKI